jgi:uncharacterized delta-60 repeat protein
MRRTSGVMLATALSLGVGASSAQALGLDDSFGLGGVALTPVSATTADRFLGVARGPGGSTYAVGFVNPVTDPQTADTAMAVTKLDAHGNLDPSFGGDGIATVNVVTGPFAPAPGGAAAPTGAAEIARGIGVQSDGKIVIVGQAETPQVPAPADSRDLDIYVSRLLPNGTIDASFGDVGTPGTRRISLSNGDSTGDAIVPDQAWGLTMLSDDKFVVVASRGTDIVARPGRTDRDWAVMRFGADGTPDPTFSGGGGGPGVSIANGTAVINGVTENLSDNPRQAVVQPDGKIVLGAYSGGASDMRNRPRVVRFLTNGSLDPTFGVGGLATADFIGPDGSPEVYDIAMQGTSFITTGYGRNINGRADVDMVSARFTSSGTWDQSYGTDGAARFNLADQEDRGRDLVVLPDGRILIAGGSRATAPNLDGLLLLLAPDGTPDPSFGTDGHILVELGGPSDHFFGSTLVDNATKVVATGYRGAATGAGDESAAARVALPPLVGGPAGPAGERGPAGPGGSGSGTTGTSTNAAARTTLSCKRRGKRKNKAACSVGRTSSIRGVVKVSLVRGGKTAARGQRSARSRSITINLRGTVRAGTYTATATLPTSSGKFRTKVTKRIVLR